MPGLGPTRGGDPLAFATVLVVDDEPSNVALLELFLRDAGVTAIHGVTDARAVVSRCVELQPDLVLLDLHMPHMDGLAVLAALRAALPADRFLPVLMLTADLSVQAREDALDAGAKDFLTKPFDHVETILRVRNLLETAALYGAVQSHNTRLRAELDERSQQERQLRADRVMRRARIDRVLRDGTLSMVFQPIVELGDGRLTGVEALARFDSEPRRPPDEWFAEAAEVGLGAELELAAVKAALRHLDHVPPDVFMSVNVSAATAVLDELVDVLATGRGSRIVLELTEHARIEDYEPLLAAMDRHRLRGVRIAVDDAGAGHAGLRHLLRLRPDIIKLDMELARDIHVDPARRALVSSLVTFAEEIGAVMVAEGIENHDDLATLRNLRVPWGQGYHLGRPTLLPAPASSAEPARAMARALAR